MLSFVLFFFGCWVFIVLSFVLLYVAIRFQQLYSSTQNPLDYCSGNFLSPSAISSLFYTNELISKDKTRGTGRWSQLQWQAHWFTITVMFSFASNYCSRIIFPVFYFDFPRMVALHEARGFVSEENAASWRCRQTSHQEGTVRLHQREDVWNDYCKNPNDWMHYNQSINQSIKVIDCLLTRRTPHQ